MSTLSLAQTYLSRHRRIPLFCRIDKSRPGTAAEETENGSEQIIRSLFQRLVLSTTTVAGGALVFIVSLEVLLVVWTGPSSGVVKYPDPLRDDVAIIPVNGRDGGIDVAISVLFLLCCLESSRRRRNTGRFERVNNPVGRVGDVIPPVFLRQGVSLWTVSG